MLILAGGIDMSGAVKKISSLFSNTIVGGLLGQEEPPKLEEPPVAPVADEQALAAARQRTAAQARGRGGRASTVLTSSGGTGRKLGG